MNERDYKDLKRIREMNKAQLRTWWYVIDIHQPNYPFYSTYLEI